MPAQKPHYVVRSLAPAKLNLFLELLGKRDDGFHELETIMVAINRFDRIELGFSACEGVQLDCCWLPNTLTFSRRSRNSEATNLPAPNDNLVYKALEQFKKRFGIEQGFHARLAKSIPSGAGMGGASSDAAHALVLAARLCGVDPQDPRLVEIGGHLGSDIPFFFGIGEGIPRQPGGNCAVIASGRGEITKAIPCRGNLHFVVVHPPEPLSTAAVYSECTIPESTISSSGMLDALARGDIAGTARNLFNRLSQPAREISDWVDRVLHALRSMPVAAAQITGSGSACFGICQSASIAKRIANALSAARLGLAFSASTAHLGLRPA